MASSQIVQGGEVLSCLKRSYRSQLTTSLQENVYMTTDIYTVLEIEGKIKVTLVGFFGPSGISALDNFRFA